MKGHQISLRFLRMLNATELLGRENNPSIGEGINAGPRLCTGRLDDVTHGLSLSREAPQKALYCAL